VPTVPEMNIFMNFVLRLISGTSWFENSHWTCVSSAAQNYLKSKVRLILVDDHSIHFSNVSLLQQIPVYFYSSSSEVSRIPQHVQDRMDVVLLMPEIGDRVLGARGTRGRILALTKQKNYKLWRDYLSVDVVNILINDSRSLFFTWFPYSNCSQGNYLQFRLLDFCFEDGTFLNNTNLFPNKVPDRFLNCTFKVAPAICPPYSLGTQGNISDISGPEMFLLRSITDKLHLSIEYVHIHFLSFFRTFKDDGSLNGAMEKLALREADLSVGCMLRSWERTQYASYLPSYWEDLLVFSVPPPQPKPLISGLYSGFGSATWTIILLAVICKLFIVFVEKAMPHQQAINSMEMLDVIRVTLGLPALFNPRNLLTMVTFIISQISSLHILWFYQSTLLICLFRQPLEKPIKSLEEAADSNLYFQFRPSHKMLLNHSYFEVWNKLLAPGRHTMTYNVNLSLVTEDKSSIILGLLSNELLSYQEMYPEYKLSMSSKVVFLKKPLSLLDMVMYMPINHPLHSIMTREFWHLIESGLFNHWLHPPQLVSISAMESAKPLVLLHLQSAFFLTFLLFFVSILILISEIFFNKYYICPP